MLSLFIAAHVIPGPGLSESSVNTIVSEGASEYVIITAADAPPADRTAARELSEHIFKMSGAKIPVIDETAAEGKSRFISVGLTEKFLRSHPGIDIQALGEDGIVLKSDGPAIYLAGGRPRGSLYAVYTLLEEHFGVRWWTPAASFVPEAQNIEAGPLDEVYVPPLTYREQFNFHTNRDGVFASRLKLNGTIFHNPGHRRIPGEYGGHHLLLGWVHTFWMLLPHDKYAEAHPEWYSEIGGERVARPEPGHPRNVQLCLTNEEMTAELARNAIEWLRENPRATMISITPNDGHGACECKDCAALVKREEAQSGPIVRFVNRVAEEIEKEFPDILVETMAYSYYQKPPRYARPRHNVLIRKATFYHTSWSEPFAEGEANKIFREHFEGWGRIHDKFFIWDYVTNFRNYILPHPNLPVIAPNIRYFADNNVKGLFLQGDAHCSAGDFVEMRGWVQAQLMWRPERDIDSLIDEFLEGYYGAAAGYLRNYLDTVNGAQARAGGRLPIYYDDASAFLTLSDLNACADLFDRAEEAVRHDEELFRRVRRARMPLDHDWILRYWRLRNTSVITGLPFNGPDSVEDAIEDFIARAEKFGVGRWREGQSFADYKPALRALKEKPAVSPPPRGGGRSR